MKAARTEKFFIYPKNKDGKYSGHTICVIQIDGRMYQGIALCNENDQFTKKIGQELAEKRALEASERYCPTRSSSKVKKGIHYSSVVDKDWYPNQPPVWYRVSTKAEHYPTRTKKTTVNKVTIRTSGLDENWGNSNSKMLELTSDGNGFDVKTYSGNTFRLDYLEAANLGLALRVYHKKSHYNHKWTKVRIK